ncbi:hypothetical protein SLI_3632 [Streptomyces lividans 1326]|uniref:Uncharacterized protein n=1 Tax=Streptomyces lividans 1326 TaxID=1200984 RepID=A0A7U9DS26_STRLI|nr:hypothetical protein SLI_3632 [Streptomyces lividans 1326]
MGRCALCIDRSDQWRRFRNQISGVPMRFRSASGMAGPLIVPLLVPPIAPGRFTGTQALVNASGNRQCG